MKKGGTVATAETAQQLSHSPITYSLLSNN